jgi:hypothetical protein
MKAIAVQSSYSPGTHLHGLRKTTRTKIRTVVRFDVFTAVIMKNGVFWDVTPCGYCKNTRFGELSAAFNRLTRIGELGTRLSSSDTSVHKRATRRNIPNDANFLRTVPVQTNIKVQKSLEIITWRYCYRCTSALSINTVKWCDYMETVSIGNRIYWPLKFVTTNNDESLFTRLKYHLTAARMKSS